MEVKKLEVPKLELKCKNCGATLEYEPGQEAVVCPYCNTKNEIKFSFEEFEKAWEEKDFEKYLRYEQYHKDEEEIKVLKCPGCGAEIEVRSDIIATECPYCGTPLVLEQAQISKAIKPQGIIPFKVTEQEAKKKFVEWARSRWFAPSSFRKYISAPSRVKGSYLPYWTFDAKTITRYRGERGDYYYETEVYYENGERRERTVRRIRWTPVSGTVYLEFDDVLVRGHKNEKADIGGWNLADLVPYDRKFLAGYYSEAYSIGLADAFEIAKMYMEPEIRREVRRDIGGDEQRIHWMKTYYNDVTFKHILLPVYYAEYKFKGKKYYFAVNGQTGKVKGKYPISFWKVLLVILLVLLILLLLTVCFGYNCSFSEMFNDLGLTYSMDFDAVEKSLVKNLDLKFWIKFA